MLCYSINSYCISGFCSATVTSTTWVGTVTGVETSIALGGAQLAKLKELTVTVLGQIEELEELVDESIKFLEEELAILRQWEAAAYKVKEKIEMWTVEQLQKIAAFQKIFVMSLDDLGAAAQAFLDQGVHIFAEDENPDNHNDGQYLRYSTD